MARIEPVVAHAACDGEGLLLSADEPLAGLQLRCGGVIPGEIAVPALRMLDNYEVRRPLNTAAITKRPQQQINYSR